MKITALATVLTLWPFFASADVTISDGWARASILASRPAAAYLTLTSDQSDQLVAITTPIAGNVTIHAVENGDDGVSRMIGIDALDLPSGEPVTLAPGSMSYAGTWVTQPDQAARFSAPLAATPSVNLTPSMTIGNRFAPFRRRHVLAAV